MEELTGGRSDDGQVFEQITSDNRRRVGPGGFNCQPQPFRT